MLLVCCVRRFAKSVQMNVASMKWIIANIVLNVANDAQWLAAA